MFHNTAVLPPGDLFDTRCPTTSHTHRVWPKGKRYTFLWKHQLLNLGLPIENTFFGSSTNYRFCYWKFVIEVTTYKQALRDMENAFCEGFLLVSVYYRLSITFHTNATIWCHSYGFEQHKASKNNWVDALVCENLYGQYCYLRHLCFVYQYEMLIIYI